MVAAARHDKRRKPHGDSSKREEQFRAISDALSGGFGGPVLPFLSKSKGPLPNEPAASKSEKESLENFHIEDFLGKKDEKRDFADFAYTPSFLFAVSFSMIKNNGYSRASFVHAFAENYNSYNPRMVEFNNLRDLFLEMFEKNYFSNTQNYINDQWKHNEEGISTSNSEEVDTAYTLYEEARLRLSAEGVQTENVELKKLIFDDVKKVSEKLVDFFLSRKCVADWDVNEVVNLLIMTEVNFVHTFGQIFCKGKERFTPDTDCSRAFSSIDGSTICDIYNAITALRTEDEKNQIKSLLAEYGKKNVLQYKGKNFDEEGDVFRIFKCIKNACGVVSRSVEIIDGRKKVVSDLDKLRSIAWYSEPPFEVDRFKLSIPKGCFMVDVIWGGDAATNFALFFDGRTCETEVFYEDEENGHNLASLGYCPSSGKYRVYGLEKCESLFISSFDSVSYYGDDCYAKPQEWFQEVSQIALNLKYAGLQMIANVEKIFPHIFDEAYNMDPIQIYVDQEEGTLEIRTTRTFLDRNLDNLKVVKDSVYSKQNELFEGTIKQNDNVEVSYASIGIKFVNDDPNDCVEKGTVSDVILQFPLSIFIDGQPVVKEASEISEAQKADEAYWEKIDDFFRVGNKNRFTYDEILELLGRVGEVIVKRGKLGGKGSHNKIFMNDENGSFATVSKRKRQEDFYLIDLKKIIRDMGISYEDFYKTL